MKLVEINKLLDGEILTNHIDLSMEVKYAFGCDLMSDVLTLVSGETILLTGLTNIQTIRTAELLDIKCIIFVRGKKPERQVIELAQEKGIHLISTEKIMFTACGLLHRNGVKGAVCE